MKKYLYSFLGGFLGLGIVFILLSGGGHSLSSNSITDDVVSVGLPKEVLQYEKIVKEEATKENIADKVNLLLAIMAVESGGRGNDVMQSSESLGLSPNSLQPLASIRQGVKYYASLLRSARAKGSDDDVAIGAYNFGGGYIDFVSKNGNKHTLAVAEKFSHDVVAPSLGNRNGQKYYYGNPVANNHGNYLYLNGGNFYYVDLVKRYLTSGSGSSATTIAILNSVLGQSVYNGECYGLIAYYVDKLGGPQMMGSGFLYAESIGSDYDWASYGWEVIFNPAPADIKAGDIINWKAGGALAPGIYGHTGIVAKVYDGGKRFDSYEQNSEKGRICATYTRTYEINPITSIVRKK
ncbi:lysozyme family protein [Enterococcus sp. DIV1420a]|uniref:lysozyme family protein n=1 Tax=Enterococcus sp. DIV1420a TaxID=2774672 RepID=UPI003F258815